MKRVLTLIISAIAGIQASGQSFTLEQAIAIAQDSTVSAYATRNAELASRYEYEQFRSTFLPQISFQLNPGYQKFTNEPFTHYYKLRNYNMLNTFGEIRIEQKFAGLGGNFYASSGTMWTEYFGANAAERVFSSIPVGVGYTNDLIGYNPNKWAKQIMDFHSESEKLRYKYQMHLIARKAEGLFIGCVIAKQSFDICKTNSSVTKKIYEIGQEKYAIASITKNELFALQLQCVNAENQFFKAEQELKDAIDNLSSFLQIDCSSMDFEIPLQPEYIAIDLQNALELAKANNPDYRNTRESVMEAQSNHDKARAETALLRTGLDLNVGIQNNANTFGASYANQKSYFTGGITLKIPIYDGGYAKNKRKATSYRLELARNEADEAARQLAIDVTVTVKDFNTLQDQLVRTKNALDLADESFALASDLYGNGEIDINTFILTLNRKDEAHQNYLLSLKEYWDSLFLLESLCVSSFR